MTYVTRGLIVAVTLFSLVACSSNDEKKVLEPLPLVEFEQTTSLNKIWTAKVGKGLAKKLYSISVPAIEGDRVFSADQNGKVFAFDLQTGKTLWSTDVELALSGSTSVKQGQVYVAGYDGDIIALNAENGEELWRSKVSSEVLAAPQSNGSEVAISSVDGALTVLKASTGEKLWAYGHVVPVLTHRGLAAPIINATQVIAAFDNGQVLAFNVSDGSSLWEVRLAQPTGRHDLERIVDIDGTPLQNGGFIYAATYQGAITAISRAQGRIIWKQEISSSQPLVLANRKLFAVTADGKVIAYNANNGAQEWENAQMLRRNLGAPATLGDYVVSIDEEGYMHVLNQLDGTLAARISANGKRFRSPLVSADNTLYVLSGDGKLSAYELAN